MHPQHLQCLEDIRNAESRAPPNPAESAPALGRDLCAWGFPAGSDSESAWNAETRVCSLLGKDPLEKEMATHSSILAWKIPWTVEPGPWGCKESDMIE